MFLFYKYIAKIRNLILKGVIGFIKKLMPKYFKVVKIIYIERVRLHPLLFWLTLNVFKKNQQQFQPFLTFTTLYRKGGNE